MPEPEFAIVQRIEPQQDTSAELRREIRRLERELDSTTEALKNSLKLQKESQRALISLRRQLAPWYSALREVFGELDDAGISDSSPSIDNSNSKTNSAWDIWKSKLGGKQADFIQAMLDHGEMTSQQLRVATHSGSSTVPMVLSKLIQLGLVRKNGGRYSLKES